MKQDISLWSPVIIASLSVPHKCRQESRYPVGPLYKRLEDIKIKIRDARTEPKGKSLETRVKLEIIILLEDLDGKMALFSRPEIIKQQLSLGELDQPVRVDEEEPGYITRIHDLSWDGGLQDNDVIINYSLSYIIFAVREQVVKLYAEDEIDYSRVERDCDRQAYRGEAAAENESDENWKKKIFLYERDILSLQHAVKKAEERNAVLNRELTGTQQLLHKLQDAVTRKDLLISHYENHSAIQERKNKPLPAFTNTVGQRLKRMFISCL